MNKSSIVYILNKSFNRKHYVPPHAHTCYELIFYENAPVNVKYNSEHEEAKTTFDFDASLKKPITIKLRPNSFVLIKPNVSHDEYHLDNNSIMCVGFIYGGSEPIDDFTFKEILDERVGIRLILEQICDEFINKKYGFEEYINNLLENLLLTLFRSTKQDNNSDYKLKYIEQYIKQNIGRNLTVASLSDMAGYSLSHFRRVFKEKIGVSPKRYIAKQRIETAKRLLCTTQLTLNEIGESIGFSDYYQFVSFYKKECGISPGRERKQQKMSMIS